jgi:hypothetical protein
MLSEKSINNIQIRRFSLSTGSGFYPKNGLLLAFPFDIPFEELQDVHCDYCPLNENIENASNQRAASDRRRLIRCSGQLIRLGLLGPIHISDYCENEILDSVFKYEDATLCGIHHDTLKKVMQSRNVVQSGDIVRLGEI